MDQGFEAHLRVGDRTVDAGDVALLRAIDDHRSLNAAASALGRSYSRAHSRITDIEAAVGPLVERRRGGSEGGGSELTENARQLIAKFARLQAALDGTASTEEVVFEGTVVDREGELVTVDTPTGSMRAVLFGDYDCVQAVQVTFRADAVTLHDPASAPPAGGTSARNRFEGTVEHVDEYEAVVTVALDVGAETPLRALITRESFDRLGVRQGTAVVATFKATATRATPV